MLPMSQVSDWLMTHSEVERLCSFAEGNRVLELGSYRGHTTARLAKVAAAVWSVDHHRGDDWVGHTPTLLSHIAHLDAQGVRDRVVLVVGDFREVRHGLSLAVFDLVIVDGAHDSESVARDIELAVDCCAPGGVIAVHDYGRGEVTQATRDALGEPNELVGSLALYCQPMPR